MSFLKELQRKTSQIKLDLDVQCTQQSHKDQRDCQKHTSVSSLHKVGKCLDCGEWFLITHESTGNNNQNNKHANKNANKNANLNYHIYCDICRDHDDIINFEDTT